mmetsp:Transcript_43701/g.138623  ORF Transcript_43701/g.138623 Transcript_43701/m.138623 type:complete len:267 (+) Transcript_43701:92-892(+)
MVTVQAAAAGFAIAAPAPAVSFSTPCQGMDAAAYASQSERETQALREQVFALRRLLEHKEAQVAHYSHLWAAACHESDSTVSRLRALQQLHPCMMERAMQSLPGAQPAAGAAPAPAEALRSPTAAAVAAAAAAADAAAAQGQGQPPQSPPPGTPSKTVLSLQSMTPVPRVSNFVASTLAAAGSTQPPPVLPSPTGADASSRPVPLTPHRMPASAPPASPPACLSPERLVHAQPPPGEARKPSPPTGDSTASAAILSMVKGGPLASR